jgi:hypothetical protein
VPKPRRAPNHKRLTGTDKQKARLSTKLLRAVEKAAANAAWYEKRMVSLAAAIRQDIEDGGIVDEQRVFRVDRLCDDAPYTGWAKTTAGNLLRDIRANTEKERAGWRAYDAAPIAQQSTAALVEPKPSALAPSALAEAEQIIRNLTDADLEIDWSQEPSTDRERKVRAALLRSAESKGPSFSWLYLSNMLHGGKVDFLNPESAASDFRDAWVRANVAHEQDQRERKRAQIRKAIREIDGGAT